MVDTIEREVGMDRQFIRIQQSDCQRPCGTPASRRGPADRDDVNGMPSDLTCMAVSRSITRGGLGFAKRAGGRGSLAEALVVSY